MVIKNEVITKKKTPIEKKDVVDIEEESAEKTKSTVSKGRQKNDTVIKKENVERKKIRKEEIKEAAGSKAIEKKGGNEEKITKIISKKEERFDWETYSVEEDYEKEERNRLEKLYEKTLSSIAEKEVITGTVIGINKKEVIVDIGFKSDGIIASSEFRYNPELKPGDMVEVYVENQEDKKGQLVLSHKKARSVRSWDRVNKAYKDDEIIKGYIKCRTKGGMIVDVFGIESFLPGSQIDVKPIRDFDVFVGKTMEFKVVKINEEFKNVVISHKILIEAELEQQKDEIISKLEKGQVLEGTVKNITSYGVFIDLGGVDGLIHITDLSWGRVSHPSEIVELDQELNVVILDFDNEKRRIALGLKQLTPHPWDKLDPELKVGDIVKGRIVVLADYGAFIEIAPGVEGLIHVSEMSWSQHLRSAQDFLSIGDEVEAMILTLEREERRMSLGIKQLQPDPWKTIIEKYPVGSKHKAIVRNFTNFGIFIEIEEGVDGLIHISDLSWIKKIKHPAEFTSIGSEIEVVVLEIDEDNRRLSLGHKQLKENPWDTYESIFTVGSEHEGSVIEIVDKGALVSLPHGIKGFSTPRHLVKKDGTKAKLGENLFFKILEFSKSSKRIIVSHARIHEDSQRMEKSTRKKSTARRMKKMSAGLEKTTLGDISELAALKTRMQDSKAKKTITAETTKKEATGENKKTTKKNTKSNVKLKKKD